MSNNKPKTVQFNNVKYAMASELGENHNFLERLVAERKVSKINTDGNNYYEVDKVRKLSAEMRTVPPGYVRAVDHAILLGSTSQAASDLCARKGSPAKKVMVNGFKAAWFVDKAWMEKQLGKTLTPKPTIKAPPKAPTVVTNNHTAIGMPTLAELQATIQELRGVVQNLVRGRTTPEVNNVTEEIAREQGYRPLQDLSKELDVATATLLGWKNRNQVRYYKVSGRVFLNVEDTERMYLQLDANRATIAERMGTKTNNRLKHTNGVS